jgi:hypothetical protein
MYPNEMLGGVWLRYGARGACENKRCGLGIWLNECANLRIIQVRPLSVENHVVITVSMQLEQNGFLGKAENLLFSTPLHCKRHMSITVDGDRGYYRGFNTRLRRFLLTLSANKNPVRDGYCRKDNSIFQTDDGYFLVVILTWFGLA